MRLAACIAPALCNILKGTIKAIRNKRCSDLLMKVQCSSNDTARTGVPSNSIELCSASKNGCFDVATKQPNVDDLQLMKHNIQK